MLGKVQFELQKLIDSYVSPYSFLISKFFDNTRNVSPYSYV
jgi:hypothetical protein